VGRATDRGNVSLLSVTRGVVPVPVLTGLGSRPGLRPGHQELSGFSPDSFLPVGFNGGFPAKFALTFQSLGLGSHPETPKHTARGSLVAGFAGRSPL
jgi:hypothetical protein